MMHLKSLINNNHSRLLTPQKLTSLRITKRPQMFHGGTLHDPTKNPISNESATKILREMLRHVWPREEPALKLRVVGWSSKLF